MGGCFITDDILRALDTLPTRFHGANQTVRASPHAATTTHNPQPATRRRRFRPMSRVALLSEIVASQVAAGEVVERPASVVKELVENSARRAGAQSVEVAIQRGGIALVRVVDDGFGMDRDDALLCLETACDE